MRLISKNFQPNILVTLKDQNWLDKQRIAGKVVAGTLSLLEQLVKDKTTKSLLELDAIAEEFIIKNGCTPTFKGYKGHGNISFPNSVCMSVNEQLVHGVATDRKLQEGDVISFDLGATYEEVIGDAARTCIFGHPKSEQHVKLIQTTKECLTKSIESISIGKRLGCIGNTIFKHARHAGFSVVDSYGGHSIDFNTPHAAPFVSNRSNLDEGIRIQSGLTLAIEPLLVIGSSNKTRTSSDGWSVSCDNICAHEENTIFIHEDKVEILTILN